MKRFATLLAAGSLASLGLLSTPSYGQIHINIGNPNQPAQPGPSGNMTGSQVFDRSGNNVGTLSSVVTDPRTGQPLYGIVSTGGIFGFGASEHPVPWQLFSFSPNGASLAINQDMLRNAPSYSSGNQPNLLSGDWQRRIANFYGLQPMSGPGYAGQDPFQRLFNRNDMESVSGTVTSVYHHTQGDQIQVALRADDGRTILAVLAPEGYLENVGAEPREGDALRLRGSRAFQNGREFLIATDMHMRDRDLDLRSRDGMPLWGQQAQPQGPIGGPSQYGY